MAVSILLEHARQAGRNGDVFRPIILQGYMALTHLVSAEDSKRPIIGRVRNVSREAGAALEARPDKNFDNTPP